MGGEVIIITQDPDIKVSDPMPTVVRHTPPLDEPKLLMTEVRFKFSEAAGPDEVAWAVKRVLQLNKDFQGS